MLCEIRLQSTAAEGAHGCYLTLAKSLVSELAEQAVADVYALALYRFYVDEPEDRRLLGLMKLSLQCAGTPAGLKAVNYLKGYWRVFAAAQRLDAWQSWGSGVHTEEISKCPDVSKNAQVIAIVALERARAHLEIEQARDAAILLKSVWPVVGESVWWDDVAMVRAEALRHMGKPQEALGVLDLFLERREDSYFVGSYESIFFDEAMMMRAGIFESMGNTEAARQAYLRLIADAPTSRLCDDAAYRAALLAKGSAVIEELKSFLETYPDSRWVGDAQRAANL